jgi:tripartite-type tricarboxylate transporter receptor subunit TctC
MKRRHLILTASATGTSLALPAWAQTRPAAPAAAAAPAVTVAWPTENVRLIVPFAAGGGTDRLARLMAQRLGEKTGKSFVVENKPGAGGNIGAAEVVRAASANALLFTTASIAVSPFLYTRPGYDLLKDLQPVVQVSSSPLVLVVRTASPVKAASDLVAAASAKSGGLNYGSPGIGTTSHLGGFLMAQRLKMAASHVAYRGAGPAITALISGEIDFALMAAVAVLPFIKNGQLRAVGVAGNRPLADLATTPLLGGAPLGLDLDNWQGVFMATKAGPKGLVDRINATFNEVLRSQDVRTAVYADGATPVGGTSAALAGLLRSDGAKYGGIVVSAGVKPE